MSKYITGQRVGSFFIGVGIGVVVFSWYLETLVFMSFIISSIFVVLGLLFYIRSNLNK